MLLKTAVDLARHVAMLYGLKENLQKKESVLPSQYTQFK